MGWIKYYMVYMTIDQWVESDAIYTRTGEVNLMTNKHFPNKAKRSAKQQRSDLVIVFHVQCSQGSTEQTHHHKKRREELQCSVVNSGGAL